MFKLGVRVWFPKSTPLRRMWGWVRCVGGLELSSKTLAGMKHGPCKARVSVLGGGIEYDQMLLTCIGSSIFYARLEGSKQGAGW